ncbi:hypothetical protein [Polaribacter ponticola]|uniref:Bacterial Pleckstrin homology domain-containing protein n=1 Tax=Polaribacter ponticola TaxID=2978475 RepID=A0ABT5S8D5_9FLAO|nr:hypothetical protein [Polaribacter sp. MSW5]MDD7914376.1 hypothetical protein [Polaribacter sp. MSW5]
MKIFKEVQRFTQTWLVVLIIISGIVPIAIIVKEYFEENTTMSTNEFILTLVGITVSLTFILFFKLKTRIDEKGIHYQFFPFHFSLKTILWSEIKSAKVRTYDPIGEFGGWGLKGGAFWNSGKGKAINVSGDIGIQLELKNNKKLLIGTQKESEVKRVLKTYKLKIN